MEGEGRTVTRTPIRAPLANSHIDRQNGSTRRECLDWILIVSRRHLEIVLSEWFEHYNEERLHPGPQHQNSHRAIGSGGAREHSGVPKQTGRVVAGILCDAGYCGGVIGSRTNE
jgi:hypothetical protein